MSAPGTESYGVSRHERHPSAQTRPDRLATAAKLFGRALLPSIMVIMTLASQPIAAQQAKPDVAVELRLVKTQYLEIEPIEFELRVSNRGPGEITVNFWHPYSEYDLDLCGLKFDGKGTGLTLVTPKQPGAISRAGAIVKLKPGATHVVTLFLQRFVRPPTVGEYSLPYEARIPIYRQVGKKEKQDVAAGKGTLKFTIAKKDERRLREILEHFVRRAGAGRRYYTAFEGLGVVEDPIVVRYLADLATGTWVQEALQPLARFKNVKEAQDAVLDALKSKRLNVVMDAIDILTEWKHELSLRDVKRLLKLDNESITLRVAAYAEALGQEKYRKLLPDEYRGDKDSTLKVAVTMAKAVFLEHEPIEFKIALLTAGPGAVKPLLYYPTFLSLGAERRLTFDLKGTNLKDAPYVDMDRFSLFDRRDWLKSGQTLTMRCFLQRHVSQPSPGKYRLPFKLDADYLMSRPGINNEKATTTKGELAFAVLPKNKAELGNILQSFVDQAKIPEQGTESIEALTVISDPLVVPYLLKLHQHGLEHAPLAAADPFGPKRLWMNHQASLAYRSLSGLARHKNVESALNAVLATLRSKGGNNVNRALRILAEWKHEIRVEQLKELIDRNDSYLTQDIERYVKAIGREDYKKLLPK